MASDAPEQPETPGISIEEDPEPSRFRLDDLWVDRSEWSLRRLPTLLWRSMRLVWRSARREFLLSSGLQLLAGIGIALQVLVGRRLLSTLLNRSGAATFSKAIPELALLAGVTALVNFSDIVRNEQQRVLGELVGRRAVSEVIDVAIKVDLLDFENPRFHDRLIRAQQNASFRPTQMVTGLLGVLSGMAAILGIGGALFVLQPLFLALVMCAFVPAWILTTLASKATHAFAVSETERDRRRNYLFWVLTRKEESAEVRAFGLGTFLRDRHDDLYDERISMVRRLARQRLRFGLLGGVVTSGLTAGTLGFLVWLTTSGRLSLAGAGAAATAVVLLAQRLQALSGSAAALYESSLFVEDFTSFVDTLPAVVAARPSGPAPPPFNTLSARDLEFTYPSRTTPSVRGVSLDIHRGEIVALVGENGSGKTTVAKLLAGLYTPHKGTITWDGEDVSLSSHDELRESIGIIFQDYVRYQLTVRENIALGRHERFGDDDRVHAAAERAGALRFITNLVGDFDAPLGSQFLGGNELSIGQWQRLALARAFFRDAEFVILDEPTASLDARAESELFSRMHELFHGRTVLIISHRFATVRSADRIFVLSAGEIVEAGTHDELMDHEGLYAELFTLQAAGYRGDIMGDEPVAGQ